MNCSVLQTICIYNKIEVLFFFLHVFRKIDFKYILKQPNMAFLVCLFVSKELADCVSHQLTNKSTFSTYGIPQLYKLTGRQAKLWLNKYILHINL